MSNVKTKLLNIFREKPELVLTFKDALKVEEEQRKRGDTIGWEWWEVSTPTQVLNKLVAERVIRVVFGGRRPWYALVDPEATKEAIEAFESGIKTEEVEEKIPEDLFSIIVGHEDVKQLFNLAIHAEKPVHILLVGPPATAKSTFLEELNRLPNSRFALGGTTSKAGIVDFIINERPRYLIIDELDKMSMEDMSALLSLMWTGIVARLKKGMREIIKTDTWVFAACINEDKIPQELKSRFVIKRLREYTEEEFKEVVRKVLVEREGKDEEFANYVADRLVRFTRDPRDAVKLARLCQDKEDVERVMRMIW